ncbi:class I SAM-dependent rRNA methyltransferase [Salinicoccus cyprini]|uniref:Class I SAM-dependent rRNA methyltransferase n=1 Tax=Salinicoccus cyprini TaxID=2493691 RepID=A0A558AXR6_9STAP|nr:class I SAM-dependent rRNA methyltransferase [Salinicoccus cyprini]TVT29048.1 class I SAM-dependent rRNA methyltransferase [Salinicoccus cyprini]
MNTIQLKKGHERPYMNGQLNIDRDDLSDDTFLKDGEIVRVEDPFGKLIGIAMLSFEQKTRGWILTHDEQETIDDTFIVKRIREAVEKRTPLYNQTDTTAFRLFNEIGDGIGGLTVDNYDDHLLITFYSRGIYKIRDLIIKTLMVELNPDSITEQTRFSDQGKMEVKNRQVTGNVEFPITVLESGVTYSVHLDEGPMTRLFLDQRETRKALEQNPYHAKSFLNMFAYSGTFSIAARKGGMMTTSVDLAKRSRELITENFNANNLSTDGQNIYIMEAFEYLGYAARNRHHFDVILMDPPSFARSGKKVFKVERDFPKLIRAALEILKPDGHLILSQNLESATLNQFKKQIDRTLAEAGRSYTLTDVKGLPKDFPTVKGYRNGKYLKVVTVQIHG